MRICNFEQIFFTEAVQGYGVEPLRKHLLKTCKKLPWEYTYVTSTYHHIIAFAFLHRRDCRVSKPVSSTAIISLTWYTMGSRYLPQPSSIFFMVLFWNQFRPGTVHVDSLKDKVRDIIFMELLDKTHDRIPYHVQIVIDKIIEVSVTATSTHPATSHDINMKSPQHFLQFISKIHICSRFSTCVVLDGLSSCFQMKEGKVIVVCEFFCQPGAREDMIIGTNGEILYNIVCDAEIKISELMRKPVMVRIHVHSRTRPERAQGDFGFGPSRI